LREQQQATYRKHYENDGEQPEFLASFEEPQQLKESGHVVLSR
jgi:hypothetical protein